MGRIDKKSIKNRTFFNIILRIYQLKTASQVIFHFVECSKAKLMAKTLQNQ